MPTSAPKGQQPLVAAALERIVDPQGSATGNAQGKADAGVAKSSATTPRQRIGRVISSTGLQVLVLIDTSQGDAPIALPKIGTNVVLETSDADIIASVSAMSCPTPDLESDQNEILIAELELVGEISEKGTVRGFERGIGAYPVLGDVVALPTAIDLSLIYGTNNDKNVRVGLISGVDSILATVDSTKLTQGNFAILGKPGSGKSCAAVRLVRSFFQQRHSGRVIMFDRHNEHSQSFGRAAHRVPLTSGIIPHWVLTFDELVHILNLESGEVSQEEIEILEEAIPAAKRLYSQRGVDSRAAADSHLIQLDVPVPYKVADLVSYIDKSIHTDNDRTGASHRRLRSRLMMISRDPRYAFIFGRLSAADNLSVLLSDLFRFPTEGQPVTVVDLSDLTIELADVLVSVISRLALTVAKWSGGAVPILLVLEDAHRFVPAISSGAPLTGKILGNILGRGRKLGVNVGLISSRPRSVSHDMLEQCGTLFVMRLTNKADIDAITQVAPEVASGLMASVSTLSQAEAIGMGQGLNVPARFRFDRLPAEAVPADPARIESGVLSGEDVSNLDQAFVGHLVDLWRHNGRLTGGGGDTERQSGGEVPPLTT